MADRSDPDQLVTLADLKDAIQNLALAQMQLSVAIAVIQDGLSRNNHAKEDLRVIEDNNDVAFNMSTKAFDKIIDLKAW